MIEYEKRAMIEAEDKYTFRQSTQISMQTGLIGHLRADMDTDGNGFFSSWFDFREELKTDEFKAEFDEVINSLREEGDIAFKFARCLEASTSMPSKDRAFNTLLMDLLIAILLPLPVTFLSDFPYLIYPSSYAFALLNAYNSANVASLYGFT